MRLYRIAKTDRIYDLNGTGARDHGGRWNFAGVPVVYASETRALAALEFLTHLPQERIPEDLSLATLELGAPVIMLEIEVANLPEGWRKYPAPDALAIIGKFWSEESRYLALKIPSAIFPDEFNYLINPSHPDFPKVKILKVEPFTFSPG
ncbi:MAG: RES family NAD+ phosphorylase [Bacteroidia bacterium]|nr:RES family NAD+ phosphorylase [Bacteroidia bacterium]